MRHAILSALSLTGLFATTPALALSFKAGGDKDAAVFSSSSDGAQISGTVEVPLYDVPGFETVPVVVAQVGETRLFLALEPLADEIVLTGPRVAGLKLKGKGKKDSSVASATVESLRVGELSLSNVEVATKFPKTIWRSASTNSIGRTQVTALDGYIGLQALGDVAWAIVPSAGVVRFAPAGTTGLIGDSTAVASQDGSATKLKMGTSKVWKAPSNSLKASFNGQLIDATIHYAHTGTALSASLRPDDTRTMSKNGVRKGVSDLTLGSATVKTNAVFDGGLDLAAEYDHGDSYSHNQAAIGRDVLGQLDIARDNASGQMFFALATKSQRHDPVPLMLADAEAALAKSKESAPDAEEEVQKDTTLPEGSASAWKEVAKAREAAGDWKGSLEAWETAAKFEPNGCQGWIDYGKRVIVYGNPADAKESIAKASSLYHGWWDWDAEVREALGKVLEKADEAGQDYFFEPEDIGFVEIDSIREQDVAMGAPAPSMPEAGALVKAQPDTCDSADGYLAHIAMLDGDTDTVEDLYREHFDLDRYLADIQGASALVFGDTAEAHEALRQAILREWHIGPDSYRRANLALAYAAQGNRAQAQLLLDRAVRISSYTISIYDQWRLNSTEFVGAKKTAVAAHELALDYPLSVPAQLNWLAAEQAASPDEAAPGKVIESIEALIASKLVHRPNSASLAIWQSRLLMAKGNTARAALSAKRATELSPNFGISWIVAAEAAEALGNADEAAKYRARAAQVSPRIVYYSQVLADDNGETSD